MDGLTIPNHIAVIIDGNRRWARARGLKPWEGHEYGAKTLDNFLDWCLELNVPQVSIYTLSTENLLRPKREVRELLRLLEDYLNKLETEKASLLEKYEVKIKFCGDLKKLPPSMVKVMNRIMKKTGKCQKRMINFLIAYGGKFELTEAVKKMAKKAMKSGKIQITAKTIRENLLVSGEVDLVIRTGGMQRLSNLLPWQTTYAEFIFLDKLWPDFSKDDLIDCIKEFNERQRRFGK